MVGDRALISAIEERLPDSTARGLALALSTAIRDGLVPPGTRLPPIRQLARELALSPTTVSSCWQLLARSGVVRADGRRGTVVLDRATPAPTRYRPAMDWQAELLLDLSTGIPDRNLLPTLDGMSLLSPLTPSGYLSPSVLPELRDVVLNDWPCPAVELSVVDGAMDALDLVVRTQVSFGDRVAVEHPAYPPLVDLLEAVGTQIVTLEMDEEGVLPAELERALAAPVTAVVLQPRAQNPTGVTMSAERGQVLARILSRSGALLIEDDSSGAIATSEPASLGRWLADRVVHIRSYSKSHGPDLRLAVMSGPEDVLHQIEARRHLGQGWTSRLLQRLLVLLLTDPTAVATVASARKTYAARRQALVDALARQGVPIGGTDGLNIWVPVTDEPAALVRLTRENIGVAPGSAFILQRDYPQHVRVTAGLVDETSAEPIAAALAAAARPPARSPLRR